MPRVADKSRVIFTRAQLSGLTSNPRSMILVAGLDLKTCRPMTLRATAILMTRAIAHPNNKIVLKLRLSVC